MENLLQSKIETDRLLLLPISTENVEDIFHNFTADITTYMYPQPAEKVEQTEWFVSGAIEKMEKGIDIQMVFYDKSNNEFLGCAGLHHIDWPTPELWVRAKKQAHGQWYGREAMFALKKWADENLTYEYILYPVDQNNIPSRKIPELLWAKVEREYDEKNLAGTELHILEYRIYPEV